MSVEGMVCLGFSLNGFVVGRFSTTTFFNTWSFRTFVVGFISRSPDLFFFLLGDVRKKSSSG